MAYDPEKLEQERVAQTDAAHRAIGRYIVEFSELIWAMRGMVESHVSGHLAGYDTENPPPGGDAVELLLGEATAQYIADVFFAMCRRVADLDTGEDQVTNALSTAVNNVIKERNDIAHGDWVVWFPGTPPWLGRTRPARKTGPRKHTEYPPETLERIADEVDKLKSHIVTYGQLALGLWMLVRAEDGTVHERRPGELRVGDVFVKPAGAPVKAAGPRAHLVDLGDW